MNKEVYESNVCLKKYNTMGLGGNAKTFFSPSNADDLMDFLKTNDNYFILGGGSNVILPDEDYDGTIISLKKLRKIKITGRTVKIDAGVSLSFLNNSLLKRGYTDFVWSSAIPGTLGGALYINAGCYNHDIYENLVSITVIKDGKMKTIKKKNIEYGYRTTNFTNEIIISAIFNISKGKTTEALDNMKNWAIKRLSSQPIGTKNAGSTFKNPENMSAGALIEQAGLKGYSINGASVSLKHGNFIINDGTATSEDVKKLIKHIQDEVKKVHNVDLVLENKIVSW